MIHEYVALWSVYGVFMVYFITFVYRLSAPWQVFLHTKFSDCWVFIWVLTTFVYSLSVPVATNAHAQLVSNHARTV